MLFFLAYLQVVHVNTGLAQKEILLILDSPAELIIIDYHRLAAMAPLSIQGKSVNLGE